MLTASIIGVIVCLLASVMSKSAFRWACFMAAGLVTGYALGSLGLTHLLFATETTIALMMLGSRQDLNHEWQEPVFWSQVVVTLCYLVYAVFNEAAPWLNFYLVRAANLIFLVQVMLVSFGGLTNGLRNYRWIKAQRKSGNNLPWLLTAWRMT